MRHRKISLAQRISNNMVVQSVRESFIALIPYLILISVLTLGSALLTSILGYSTDNSLLLHLQATHRSVYSLFPLAILISLSFHLGKNYQLQPVACSILGLACFITANNQLIDSGHILQGGFFGFQPYAMLLPFMIISVLCLLRRKFNFDYVISRAISDHLRLHLNFILPYTLTFFLVSALVFSFSPAIKSILSPLFETLNNSPIFTQGIMRTLGSQILWFFGIHGTNTYNLLIDTSFLAQPLVNNFRIGDVFNLFSAIGGAGNAISLVIAILLFSKDQHSRQIARISFPFACFNISEILIFGLPIIFNPYLLIPFILTPVISFILAYCVIATGTLPFIECNLSWITPPIINSWQVSNGNIYVLLFQLVIIIMGIFIYRPFIIVSHLYNNEREVAEDLAKNLSVLGEYNYHTLKPQINTNINTKSAQNTLIENILTGNLHLHYQPILKSCGLKIEGIEALLRLENSSGELCKPDFLEEVKRGSIAEVIHLWIINRLIDDIESWREKDFKPKIFVNFNAELLYSEEFTDRFIKSLCEYNDQIVIEIKERALIDRGSVSIKNIKKIHDNNFRIILDDYGHRHSTLQALFNIQIDGVNIDNTLLKDFNPQLAAIYYGQITELCHNLGLKVRAKGIETKEQEALVKRAGADTLQGWLYVTALPAKEAFHFCRSWQDKITQESSSTKK